MTRIHPVDPETVDAGTGAVLKGVRAKLGMLPNMFATMAHAPAVLNGYLQLGDTLRKGRLSQHQQELIAIAVAQANSCEYCLSAHAAIGGSLGLSEQEIETARKGQGANPENDTLIRFALTLVRSRGEVSDAELRAVREAGLDDGQIMETIAHVALNTLTNYVNRVANTVVDFPRMALLPAA